jgi:lysophospholipase L1-like esterase
MRFKVAPVVAAAMLTSVLIGAPGPVWATSETTYYVSLGDSAAAGFQPTGQDDRGYADQLYERVAPDYHDLRLLKLGCPGETSASLISGIESPCTYPARSQLAEATRFLLAHRNQITFITINIGVNDVVEACMNPVTGILDLACVQGKMPEVQANLAFTLKTLRTAAPDVPVAGMSYWNPFLGYWTFNRFGHAVASIDNRSMQAMNADLVFTYQDEGALVADVAGPDFFNIGDFTETFTARWGRVPVNVANACRWTWFCSRLGSDVHPNTTGYGVIADAFEAVLPV